ncbi:MAG: hypothetical protein V4538_17120 [Bacteroidota bacterium]
MNNKTKSIVDPADVKDKVIEGVNALAAKGIEKALSFLPAPIQGFAGSVLTKGLSALMGALGIPGTEDTPSDTDRILAELDKIKETLAELRGQLDKIQSGINMLASLIQQESERINQAAKYRDYKNAKDRIETKWTIIWGHITSISKLSTAQGDKKKLAVAVRLYHSQTVNFAKEILDEMKAMQTATLKMFDDRESLFDRMTNMSIISTQENILNRAKGIYTADGMTHLKRESPEIWQKLLDGPCGPAMQNPAKYPMQGKHLPNYWYGDNWFSYMSKVKPIIDQEMNNSPVSVFFSEINMMASKSLMMLAVIYGDNEGLTEAANAVIDVVNTISTNANNNAKRYTDTMHAWVSNTGKWVQPADKKYPPAPDLNTIFGNWANQFINTGTNVSLPGTYVVENGQYYPCSVYYNTPNRIESSEKIWRSEYTPGLMMSYYCDGNKLAFKMISLNLGENVPTWFKKAMKTKEIAIEKATKFIDK